MAWVDPKEHREGNWCPSEPPPSRDTVARAVDAGRPFRFSASRHYPGTFPPVTLDGYTFRGADVSVDGKVGANGEVQIHARGYLWTERPASPRVGRRFKILVRRPEPPCDTTPFGTYEVWERRRYGSLRVADDGVDFRPDPRTTGEGRGQKEFEQVPDSLKLHIAELELVRNPPFAAHMLRERDAWTRFRSAFQYHPDAFERRSE
ncbi:MAG: hypothetical protein ABEJ79_12025 [Halolamina sp.]